MVRTTPLQSSGAPAICRPCMPACSANAQTGVSQMTTCWFNLISWPVKPRCKFSSLFANYAKGRQCKEVWGIWAAWPPRRFLVAWLCSNLLIMSPAASFASPPCQFPETVKTFLPANETFHHQRRFSYFHRKMQLGGGGLHQSGLGSNLESGN